MKFPGLVTLKKLLVLAALLFAVVLLSSCNYFNNVKLLTSGSLNRTDFTETIPFKYHKDLIVVEARINKQEQKKQFIFDTGAFDSKIEIGLAEELDLPTEATKTNSTAQVLSETIDVTRLEKVILGKTEFANISAGKLSYGEQSASRCIAPHGIIGANLMKLAHWKIDYQNEEIQFSDQPFKLQEEEKFTLEFDKPLFSGTPEIEIAVAGKRVGGILFDVGYNGGLILPAHHSDSFPSEDKKEYFDRSTSGIFGTRTDTLISKQLEVSLAGNILDVPVMFSSIGKALLGNDILEHFLVSINYNENRIDLYPRSEVEVDMPYSFIPGMLNDSLWVVNRTTSNSSFALGDTLQSVEGQSPSDLYSSFCDYFNNINTLLETNSLSIIKIDGSPIILDPRN